MCLACEVGSERAALVQLACSLDVLFGQDMSGPVWGAMADEAHSAPLLGCTGEALVVLPEAVV